MSENLLSVATTEYQALREEIPRRSVAQGTLVSAAPTVGGLAITVGAVTQQNILISVLVPVLSVSFGLLWLDHAQQIENLGSYIQKTLEPAFRRLVADEAVMIWDKMGRAVPESVESRSFRINGRMALPILFVFLAPAFLATTQGAITSFNLFDSTSLPVPLFLLAIIVTAIGFALECLFVKRWLRVIHIISDSREQSD